MKVINSFHTSRAEEPRREKQIETKLETIRVDTHNEERRNKIVNLVRLER